MAVKCVTVCFFAVPMAAAMWPPPLMGEAERYASSLARVAGIVRRQAVFVVFIEAGSLNLICAVGHCLLPQTLQNPQRPRKRRREARLQEGREVLHQQLQHGDAGQQGDGKADGEDAELG